MASAYHPHFLWQAPIHTSGMNPKLSQVLKEEAHLSPAGSFTAGSAGSVGEDRNKLLQKLFK